MPEYGDKLRPKAVIIQKVDKPRVQILQNPQVPLVSPEVLAEAAQFSLWCREFTSVAADQGFTATELEQVVDYNFTQ